MKVRERHRIEPAAAILAALHNIASDVKLKTPPGSKCWTPAHFLPRRKFTAAEVVERLKAALSKPKLP